MKDNKSPEPTPMSTPVHSPKSPLSITDFTKKHCSVLTYVDGYLKTYGSSDIETWFGDPRDLESIALLLRDYDDEIVSDVIRLLLRFIPNITSELCDGFHALFPFVSIIVGALQYLMKYVENLAEEASITFGNILLTFFDHDGTVNEVFVRQFFDSFRKWFGKKTEDVNERRGNVNSEKVAKKKERCTVCRGVYFVFDNE